MRQKTLNNTYLSMLCAEIAMLLDAGITVADSLQILHEDEATKEAKAVLQDLIDSMDVGDSFSVALGKSGSFPRYAIHMVEIGEKTGRLVETLQALSEYYDRQERLSATIKSSVMYPAILLILMIVVVLILIVQVLPIFNNVFSQLGTQMSSLAIMLMGFGAWLGNASAAIAIVIGIVFLLVVLAITVPRIRNKFGSVFYNRWGNSGIFGKLASSRFVFAMTLGMASGLDTDEAVEIAANVSGGAKPVDEMHNKCVEMLSVGCTLAEALTGSKILSPQDGKMLSIGTRSGKADDAMAEIARRSDINVRDDIDRIVGSIEPTLVIISSVVVGIILFSVMLPLMGIMTAIG